MKASYGNIQVVVGRKIGRASTFAGLPHLRGNRLLMSPKRQSESFKNGMSAAFSLAMERRPRHDAGPQARPSIPLTRRQPSPKSGYPTGHNQAEGS
jgi:hypothetical protein